MERRPFALEADAACFDGHFPAFPVIPGVVLLDAAIDTFDLPSPLCIDHAKFLRPCLPAMALELVLAKRSPTGADLRIEHGGEIMASARLSWPAAVASEDADGHD